MLTGLLYPYHLNKKHQVFYLGCLCFFSGPKAEAPAPSQRRRAGSLRDLREEAAGACFCFKRYQAFWLQAYGAQASSLVRQFLACVARRMDYGHTHELLVLGVQRFGHWARDAPVALCTISPNIALFPQSGAPYAKFTAKAKHGHS